MNTKEAKSLLTDVRANIEMLKNCEKPHDFSIDMDTHKKFNKRYKCSKCGGYIWAHDKMWYERGLEDSDK